jgi:hypothetical protein
MSPNKPAHEREAWLNFEMLNRKMCVFVETPLQKDFVIKADDA